MNAHVVTQNITIFLLALSAFISGCAPHAKLESSLAPCLYGTWVDTALNQLVIRADSVFIHDAFSPFMTASRYTLEDDSLVYFNLYGYTEGTFDSCKLHLRLLDSIHLEVGIKHLEGRSCWPNTTRRILTRKDQFLISEDWDSLIINIHLDYTTGSRETLIEKITLLPMGKVRIAANRYEPRRILLRENTTEIPNWANVRDDIARIDSGRFYFFQGEATHTDNAEMFLYRENRIFSHAGLYILPVIYEDLIQFLASDIRKIQYDTVEISVK